SHSRTAILSGIGRSSAGGWDGQGYRIEFTAGSGYDVIDKGGATVSSGTWSEGADSSFGGLNKRISGHPADGNAPQSGPSGTRDVFATVQELVDVLEASVGSAAEQAARRNALQSSMRDVARAAQRMIDARAAGGAQLKLIEDSVSLREANSVSLNTTLSAMRDL